jgi:hypothetical protein
MPDIKRMISSEQKEVATYTTILDLITRHNK